MAYLVRAKGTKELVGFFAAPTQKRLFWIIDEVTSPYECEYQKVESGGVCWPSGDTPKLGNLVYNDFGHAEELYEDDNMSGAEFTQDLYELINECRSNYAFKQGPWRSFPDGFGLT